MTPLLAWLAGAASGLAGGVLSGLFGIGGGIVLVPLLGLALHLNQHHAQGVTLAAMLLPIGLPAVIHYRRQGVSLDWRLAGMIVVGFLAGVYLGSLMANHIPERPLRWGFVAFLMVMAVKLLVEQPGSAAPHGAAAPARFRSGLGLAIGLAGGALSGLLGIGGGVVIIPALMWGLGQDQREAQLTSLAVMLPPIGLPGVFVYAKAQHGLPWMLLLGVAVGFAAGAFLGAMGGVRLPLSRLRKAFAGLLVFTALLLAFKA